MLGPLIEHLVIFACKGFKSLEHYSLSILKEFKVYSEHELERVYISGVNVHSVFVREPCGLCEVNVAPCKNLKSLKLCTPSIKDDWLSNQISELPFPENLEIDR